MLEELSNSAFEENKEVFENHVKNSSFPELKSGLFGVGGFDPGNVPAIVPVVSTFKATKHQLPTDKFTTTTKFPFEENSALMEFERNEIRRHPSLKPMEKTNDSKFHGKGFVQKVREFAEEIAARNNNKRKPEAVISLEDFRLGKFAQGSEVEGLI